MNHIDGYFSKLKAAFAGQASKKEIIRAAFVLHAGQGATPTDAQIEIANQIVKLSMNSAAKSAIFMKKTAILAEINKEIKPVIIDIR